MDFEYEGKKWSWPGSGSYSVASILEELGVNDTINDVSLQRTVDEGGAENALYLEKKVDGWYLTSDVAFGDTFELTVKTVNKAYVIKITDASEVPASDGIKSLLTSANITGAKQEGGKYIFYPDQPYGIELDFKEVNKDNGQFPMNGSFTYQLPAGFVPTGSSTSGTLPITLSGGDHAGEIVDLKYTVSSNGLITFNWDTSSNPGGFEQLKNALYSQFKLQIDCTYSGSSGTLDFGNDITKEVEVRTSGKINLNKKGKYNAATNCIDYEVTVNSDGINKNVVVHDTVSGTALTYKKDASASSSIYGKEVPTPSSSNNGFSLTIPQMSDGETVTIKYSAAVNLDALHKNPDGSWGTLTETGNKVTVTNNGKPEGEKEIYGKDYENKISMSDISKSGSALEPDENGHAKVNWTIKANTNANVSMAGHTISDSIDGNSVPMTYDGNGIYVTAHFPDGSVAYENKFIPWSQMTKTDISWTWKIPNTWPDNQKLSYVITYMTDVDVHDRLVKTNVKNDVESDNGGHDTGKTDVTPPGGGITGRKKVVKTDIAANTITWEVSFDVPETGLDSAKIVDTVPLYYNTSGQLKAVDNYLDGTVTITPELEGDESYEITTSTDANGKEYVTIEFFKLVDEQKVTGLTGTGSKRRIRVQFQTEIDEVWKQAAIDNPNENNAVYHTNNADIIVNGQTINTSATTRVDGNEPGMNKVHGKQKTYLVNGNSLPAYPFVLTLQGLTDESFDESGKLIVEDTFNGKYLAYYPETQNNITGDNELVGYIYGATTFKDFSKGEDPIHNVAGKSTNKVVSSPEAGKILINVDRENIPVDENENFYPYYYVYYYLTVKDPIALKKLEKAIQTSESGVYNFLNTATNKDFGTVTDEFGFEIPVVDKSILKPSEGPNKLNDLVYYQNGNYMVDYKIDVNPHALELGDEEELTLTDDYENLAVDYTTIKIQKEVNGTLVDTTDADGVSWIRKGNRVTYTLKNGVHYVIKYSSRITGEPRNDGKVTYSNTAEFFGVKDWEKHDQDIKSHGSGQSPTYGITVFKHAKGAGSTPLPGAEFKLYRYGEQGEQDSWQTRPEAKIDDHNGWTEVNTVTTGTDGVARETNLAKWTWYKLVETKAPTVNGQEYQKKDFAYVFWITDSGKADYEHYVYLNDDVVAIDDEPVLPDSVTLGVTKAWTNDNGDKTRRRDITVHLYADGVPYSMWKDKSGNPLPSRDDTVKVLPLKADGTTDGYEWTGLQSGPVYSVVEDSVPGYTTTYSSKGTQVGGNINIKNKYIPGKTFIHVEKAWSDKLDPTSRAEDITVHLKRKVSANAEIRIVRNSGSLITHYAVPVGSNVVIGYDGKSGIQHEYYFENGDRPISELYRGDSISAENLISAITVSTCSNLTDHIVRYEVANIDSDGLTLRFPEDYGQTNGEYDPNLLKRFTLAPFVTVLGETEGTYTDDIDFNNENRYYTIEASNNWKLDIDRLVKEDDDGKYIYYIEEVGVNDNTETPEEAGYRVTYENNDGIEGGTGNASADTVKVINSPQTVDVDFEKNWINTEDGGETGKNVNNTHVLRVVIQLERWYEDENGTEHKIDDLYDPITLFGDTTTYIDQEYPETFKETTNPAHGNKWSAKFEELPKKGVVAGKTVEYIYKISEKQVYLSSSIDSAHNNLLKLGIFNNTEEHSANSSTAVNTFPETTLEVEKIWKDEEGNTVTPDGNVTVTVQLQRRWRDISRNYDYSGTLYPGEWSEYKDVEGATLTLTGSTWKDTFEKLPLYGWRSEESTDNKLSYVEYEYQVVEKGVTINNKPADKYYTTAVQVEAVGQTDKKVTITNTETEPKEGKLKIIKAVTSGSDATGQDFTFDVELKTEAGDAYTGPVTVTDKTRTDAEVTVNNGKISVTVTGTGSAILDKLPEGTTYTVTEKVKQGWKISDSNGIVYSNQEKTIRAEHEDNVTVTNEAEKVEIEVTKSWTSSWPDEVTSVTIGLYQKSGEQTEASPVMDGTVQKSVTITKPDSGEAKALFENLPKYDKDGNLITYSVKETKVTLSISGDTVELVDSDPQNGQFFITDLYKAPVYTQPGTAYTDEKETASVTNEKEFDTLSASKVWAESSPSSHPTSVNFKIYRVGYYTDGEQKKPASEGWYSNEEYSINGSAVTSVEGLPKTAVEIVDGSPRVVTYEYRVIEMPVEGYYAEYAVEGLNFTITNTPIGETSHKTDLEVQKKWKDSTGADAFDAHASDTIDFKVVQKAINTGYVPVTVLYQNANDSIQAKKELFVKKGASLTFTFEKGPTLFQHYVEITVGGSRADEVGGRGTTYTFTTGSINSATNITARLTWSKFGGRDTWGDRVVEYETAYQWTHDESSDQILYKDYASFYTALKSQTSTESATTSYSLTKTAICTETQPDPYTDTVTGDWKAKFTDLPQFQKVGDNYLLYLYEISELSITHNGAKETVSNGESTNYIVGVDGGTITNTEKPVKLEGTKHWIDGVTVGVSGATRPEILTIELYAGETKVTLDTSEDATKPYHLVWDKATDTNNWKYTITNLPRFDTEGKVITYKVKETVPENYKAANEEASGTVGTDGNITGADFTNTELKEAEGTKVWKKADGETALTPAEGTQIKLKLVRYRGETKDDSFELEEVVHNGTADATAREIAGGVYGQKEADWKYKWTKLDKYYNSAASGETPVYSAYTYKVEETAVSYDGGSSWIAVQNEKTVDGKFIVTADGMSVTNTQTEISVTKVWRNETSGNKVWPEEPVSITVTLSRKKGSSTDSSFGNVTISFSKSGITSTLPAGITGEVVCNNEHPENGYTLKLAGLEKSYLDGSDVKAYIYEFVEEKVDKYNTSYAGSDGNVMVDGTAATDGGQIINTPVTAVSLPVTGGLGTTPFTMLGSALMAMAAVLYGILMSRRRVIAALQYEENDTFDRRGGGSRR